MTNAENPICDHCQKEIINAECYRMQDIQYADNPPYFFCSWECIKEYASILISKKPK